MIVCEHTDQPFQKGVEDNRVFTKIGEPKFEHEFPRVTTALNPERMLLVFLSDCTGRCRDCGFVPGHEEISLYQLSNRVGIFSGQEQAINAQGKKAFVRLRLIEE